jgi:hypothetical protein
MRLLARDPLLALLLLERVTPRCLEEVAQLGQRGVCSSLDG